jgi:hypothetical protein
MSKEAALLGIAISPDPLLRLAPLWLFLGPGSCGWQQGQQRIQWRGALRMAVLCCCLPEGAVPQAECRSSC